MQQESVSAPQIQGSPAGVEPSPGIGLAIAPIQPDPTPDWSQVTPFIERLVEIAAGHRGEFLVATVGSEDPKTGEKLVPLNLHVPNDEHAMEGLLKAIKSVATERRGDNCYVGIALFRPGLTSPQKGKEADVVGVLAAVTDWDGKNDPKTRLGRLPGYPHAEVETSPGNFQCWYFFDRPYPVAEAKPVLAALARCTKSDHTQSCDHVFRVPGTLNWPSRKKIAKGRSAVPWRARLTSIADPDWQSDSITLDELRMAILAKYPDAFDRPAGASSTGEFEWDANPSTTFRPLLAETVCRKLNAPDGDRSKGAFALISLMKRQGYAPQQVFDELSNHSHLPVMGHYGDHPSGFDKALRDDIVRAFTKLTEPPPPPSFEVFNAWRPPQQPARPPRREIKIIGGALPATLDDAERALIEQGVDIFQRGDTVVRPGRDGAIPVRHDGKTEGMRLFEVSAIEMREHLTAAADFWQWDARKDAYKRIDCPEAVARGYTERKGRRNLRPLTAIIDAPTLRADGTLHDKPGYDPASALYLIPGLPSFPTIPDQPTRTDALEALLTLKSLVCDFPFRHTGRSICVARCGADDLGSQHVEDRPLVRVRCAGPRFGQR